jgi:hypothetical protein
VERLGGICSRWSRVLPLVSAVIVTALGAGITLSGLAAYLIMIELDLIRPVIRTRHSLCPQRKFLSQDILQRQKLSISMDVLQRLRAQPIVSQCQKMVEGNAIRLH